MLPNFSEWENLHIGHHQIQMVVKCSPVLGEESESEQRLRGNIMESKSRGQVDWLAILGIGLDLTLHAVKAVQRYQSEQRRRERRFIEDTDEGDIFQTDDDWEEEYDARGERVAGRT